MTNPFQSGRPAVITGAALGIGREAARRFASLGMPVAMIDLASKELDEAVAQVRAESEAEVLSEAIDVSDRPAIFEMAERVVSRYGAPAVLMNNAVSRLGAGSCIRATEWREAFEVNFWGVVNGVDAFAPAMIESNLRCVIVNMGSKQGITNPPGNTIYNVAKFALRGYSEALQHELRNRPGHMVSAHLLVPGWTTTGHREHKPGAWLPAQVVERMMEGIAGGSFYIVCPDGEVDEAEDRRRILWSAMDITEDRPPLSRWHDDYRAAFAGFEVPELKRPG